MFKAAIFVKELICRGHRNFLALSGIFESVGKDAGINIYAKKNIFWFDYMS